MIADKPRRGRPPAAEAGVAEERMLEAATALFLEQGFGRTTLDQVSRRSGTGKSALYGRFPDKEALFAAVVRCSIHVMFDELTASPTGVGVRERLRHVGRGLAENLLVPRCIALMRITAAEAPNFPDLARMAYRVSFEGSVRCVLAALDPAGGGEASQDMIRMAERFVELAIQPISFQAAFGTDIEPLRQRCADDVDDAILLLEAKGWLRRETPGT
ncbi:AcrR family transcriptional regulator [Methylorubrum extorquens]